MPGTAYLVRPDGVSTHSNINVGDKGQKVVLALSGSVLIDGHSDVRKLSELKPTKIRGVPSDAMVCSLLELGISEEHEGPAWEVADVVRRFGRLPGRAAGAIAAPAHPAPKAFVRARP